MAAVILPMWPCSPLNWCSMLRALGSQCVLMVPRSIARNTIQHIRRSNMRRDTRNPIGNVTFRIRIFRLLSTSVSRRGTSMPSLMVSYRSRRSSTPMRGNVKAPRTLRTRATTRACALLVMFIDSVDFCFCHGSKLDFGSPRHSWLKLSPYHSRTSYCGRRSVSGPRERKTMHERDDQHRTDGAVLIVTFVHGRMPGPFNVVICSCNPGINELNPRCQSTEASHWHLAADEWMYSP